MIDDLVTALHSAVRPKGGRKPKGERAMTVRERVRSHRERRRTERDREEAKQDADPNCKYCEGGGRLIQLGCDMMQRAFPEGQETDCYCVMNRRRPGTVRFRKA